MQLIAANPLTEPFRTTQPADGENVVNSHYKNKNKNGETLRAFILIRKKVS